MAIIRCISGDDGSLTPVSVEFEPGDLVEFNTGGAGDAMEVRRPFTLDNMAEHKGQLMISLDVASGSGDPIPWRPDPKLPPPPPEDGAIIFKPTAAASGTTIPIKVVIDRRS